jgi:hypothetical protein
LKEQDMEELLARLATCKSKKEYDKLLDQIIEAQRITRVTVQLGKRT